MRVFISIEIPDNIKRMINEIQSRIPDFEGKKTEYTNMHLTLKFLGEISKDKLDKVKERLRKIKFDKFKATLDSLGVFSPRQVKIVWVNIDGCEKLHKEIDNSLKMIFPLDNRFMGHLTIARVKNIDNKDLFIKKLNSIIIPNMEFEVEEFELKESRLNKIGSTYRTLEKYLLV